jgi:ABC-type Zn2+ transport system substrate-binding protein/surface adhesin
VKVKQDEEGEDHEEDEHHEDADDHAHDHGPADPHYWLDPLIVRDSIVPAIHEELLRLTPPMKNISMITLSSIVMN